MLQDALIAYEPIITALPDCQKQQDHRRLKIDRVGIRGLKYPVKISNKAFKIQNTVATFSMSVDLPAHVKGTHMSRFVEVLNSHDLVLHGSNANTMLRELQVRLEADSAFLEIEFPYFIEKEAPISGVKGLVDYSIKLVLEAKKRELATTMIVTVPVTTLCPCSKAISKFGAHNQRGYVTVAVQSEKTLWVDDIIAMIEVSASSEIYSILKRTDEKEVTEQAYRNPVFVEDLVRNIAVRLNEHKEIQSYKIEAENMESIHNHSAYACIEKAKAKKS